MENCKRRSYSDENAINKEDFLFKIKSYTDKNAIDKEDLL
jgi:hypothetical protein